MKTQVINDIEVVFSVQSACYSIRCKGMSIEKLQDVLLSFLMKKGALLDHVSGSERIYKTPFPVSWASASYSRDNWVGYNPLICFGKVVVCTLDDSISISLKAPRAHYFSGFILLSSVCGPLLNDGFSTIALVAGSAFFLVIEAVFIALKLGFKTELIKAVQEGR